MRGEVRRCLECLTAVVCCVILFVTFLQVAGESLETSGGSLPPASLQSKNMFKSIPANYFVENKGQLGNQDILFYTTSGDMQVGYAESAVLILLNERGLAPAEQPIQTPFAHPFQNEKLQSRGVLVRVSFEGSNRVRPEGRERLPHNRNFFIGNDPTGWRTEVLIYGQVAYKNLYAGVDLVYRTSEDGLKYDFIVSEGADLGGIVASYEGVDALETNGDSLVVHTVLGNLFDSIPYSYQGTGDEIACRFVLRTALSYGFDCGGRDASSSLVIDPLAYSTFLGGSGWDEGTSITVDSSGNAYVAGLTYSVDFPTTPGAFDTSSNDSHEVFVAKLNATGSGLVYSTYLGGDSWDEGYSIALDSSGNAYVAGYTLSVDFPVTPDAFDTSWSGGYDAFVAKLNATGSGLIYSTFLGGNSVDYGYSIAVDPSGDAYLAGSAFSTDFPVTAGSFDDSHNGVEDVFVAKLNATGSGLVYSTFIGGGGGEGGNSIKVDPSGNAYVTGYTLSTDFPFTSGAFDTSYNMGDAFIAKLNAAGSGLIYSTFLGGSTSEVGYSIDVDLAGNAYVTGFTTSWDFPTTPGAFDTSFNSGFDDVFVAKLDATGSGLIYATFLGGDGAEEAGHSIAVDSSGNAYVTGDTWSTGFPVTPGTFDISLNGTSDDFVVKVNATGSGLLYSTFLGGDEGEIGHSIAVDSSGDAYVTGATGSTDFPVTQGAFNISYNGTYDAFVVKLDPNNLPQARQLSVDTNAEATPGILHIANANPVFQWTYYDWEGTPQTDYEVIVGTAPGSGDMWAPGSFGTPGLTAAYAGLPLSDGTDYYFTVRVRDDAYWSPWNETLFHTNSIPNPPTPPINPSDASLVPFGSRTTIWTSGGDAEGDVVTFEWQLATKSGFNTTIASGNTTGTTSQPFITNPATIYYWRVRARDDWESTTWSAYGNSPPGYWTFNTSPPPPNTPPTITITSPSGGEVWLQGSSHAVTWTASDNEDILSNLLVWINYTSSAGSESACGPVAGNLGSCSWTLPAITATDVVINGTIVDTGGLKGHDDSGHLTIQAPPNTPPSITITSPVGGEEWLKDSAHAITWTMHDDQDVDANLTIYVNYTTGGFTHQIATALKGAVSYTWTLPGVNAVDIVVNITVIDTGGLRNWSQSGPFTIKAPPPPPSLDFISQYWWLIIVIVAVVIVLVLLILMERRKPKEETEGLPPPEPKESSPGN